MAVHRVDSIDVVFDNRQKRAKVLGNYVMGDVLGEGSYAKVQPFFSSHIKQLLKKNSRICTRF